MRRERSLIADWRMEMRGYADVGERKELSDFVDEMGLCIYRDERGKLWVRG